MEKWFRNALFATSVVNMLGAALFVPANTFGRDLLGLPAPVPALYLWIIASWIAGFGVAYFWKALSQTHDRLFIAIGAFGKLTFFLILAVEWAAGTIPLTAAAGGLWDLVIGALFVVWLAKTQ